MSIDIDKLVFLVKEANIEILDYLENKIVKEDFSYSSTIGFGGDNSLNIDLKFEEIFIKYLSGFGNILSEECGYIDNKKDITFIIDPLDGSNNFYSNLPYYGTSVAVKYKDEVIAGFVCNLPTKTLVYRVKNQDIAYFCLDKKEDITSIKNDKSRVAIFERGYKYPKICKILNDNNIKFRVLGATALSLADASSYDFVLFKGYIRDFDVSAGLFINKDLYVFQNSDTLFITKYKEKFNFFKEIINHF